MNAVCLCAFFIADTCLKKLQQLMWTQIVFTTLKLLQSLSYISLYKNLDAQKIIWNNYK